MDNIFDTEEIQEFAEMIDILNYNEISKLPKGYNVIYKKDIDFYSAAPAYCVLENDSNLYVWIRGTKAEDLDDYYISLNTKVIDYHDGFVHKDYFKGAKEIIRQLQDRLFNEKWEEIIFFGHSLGGVISQLIATILQLDFGLHNALARAFGSPPSCSETIAIKTSTFIHSYIFLDDPIPQLGVVFTNFAPDAQLCFYFIDEDLGEAKSSIEDIDDQSLQETIKLKILGNIYVIQEVGQKYEIKMENTFDKELIGIPYDIIDNHSFDRYLNVFKSKE